eukprot:1153728-Pelagomonas_calceolata.AAC.1
MPSLRQVTQHLSSDYYAVPRRLNRTKQVPKPAGQETHCRGVTEKLHLWPKDQEPDKQAQQEAGQTQQAEAHAMDGRTQEPQKSSEVSAKKEGTEDKAAQKEEIIRAPAAPGVHTCVLAWPKKSSLLPYPGLPLCLHIN